MTDPQSATFPFVDRHTKWLKPPYRDPATLIQMKPGVVTLNTEVTIKRGLVAHVVVWVSLSDSGVIAGRYEPLGPWEAQGHGPVDSQLWPETARITFDLVWSLQRFQLLLVQSISLFAFDRRERQRTSDSR